MIEPYPYNESWGSFPYNYGVDKTAGLSHYPHAIIEGHFIKV